MERFKAGVKNLTDDLRNLFLAIYRRIQNRMDIRRQRRTNRHRHHRAIPLILIIIAVLVAQKYGVFSNYPGLQDYVNFFLKIMDEIIGFSMEIVHRVWDKLNVPELWEKFQTWFWAHSPI